MCEVGQVSDLPTRVGDPRYWGKHPRPVWLAEALAKVADRGPLKTTARHAFALAVAQARG